MLESIYDLAGNTFEAKELPLFHIFLMELD